MLHKVIFPFVLDCNRHSHTDCLNKQGDCSKVSPRGNAKHHSMYNCTDIVGVLLSFNISII